MKPVPPLTTTFQDFYRIRTGPIPVPPFASDRARQAKAGRDAPIKALIVASALVSCGVRELARRRRWGEAEAKHDVAGSRARRRRRPMAALGRLGTRIRRPSPGSRRRSALDVNAYIAAWEGGDPNAPWGNTFLVSALAGPTRADVAATALPRRDPRLIPFVPDLEGAVIRLSAGPSRQRGRRRCSRASVPPRTRRCSDGSSTPRPAARCADGIGLPEASGDAKSLVALRPSRRRVTTRRASTSHDHGDDRGRGPRLAGGQCGARPHHRRGEELRCVRAAHRDLGEGPSASPGDALRAHRGRCNSRCAAVRRRSIP